jgi:hypothetical protein
MGNHQSVANVRNMANGPVQLSPMSSALLPLLLLVQEIIPKAIGIPARGR